MNIVILLILAPWYIQPVHVWRDSGGAHGEIRGVFIELPPGPLPTPYEAALAEWRTVLGFQDDDLLRVYGGLNLLASIRQAKREAEGEP